MEKIFRSYYVWPKFPSISMSGNRCKLQCKHCNHTYLNDMQNLLKPEKFLETCIKFYENGYVGFLLSGGCNKDGEMLNLKKLLPTIKKVKNETDLIIKLHTGLVDKELAEDIVSAGVDIASIEVVGSNETIREIFDFNATINTYINSLQNLESAGMPYIVPHICIGLHYGELKGEFDALGIIEKSCNPALLVIIIFRPTKGTVMENCKFPSKSNISVVIKKAKEIFPDKELSLGCIRPRANFREEIEITSLHSGVTRMEIPSKNTIKAAEKMGFTIKKINACCALPQDLENRAIIS